MIVNHILAASRIPYILEQRNIQIEGNLLSIDIDDKKGVSVLLLKCEDVLKFEGSTLKRFDNPINDYIGRLEVELEGVKIFACVYKTDLVKLNIEN